MKACKRFVIVMPLYEVSHHIATEVVVSELIGFTPLTKFSLTDSLQQLQE